MTDPSTIYQRIRDETDAVLIGCDEILERLTISLISDGHVLLEGIPGVGKTTIAHIFARTLGLDHNRVQMTPDLLPADITGTRIYRENAGTFEIERGPVFSNLVVTDEINRTTPKTQSALLEAMQERQVTIGDQTLDLPSPFMVIATQNPIEMEGTFGLPEAQRDRFQMKVVVDLLDRPDEAALLDRFDDRPDLGPEDVEQVVNPDELREARRAVDDVYFDSAIRDYVLDIAEGTRESADVAHGVSSRAAISLLKVAKARAAIRGRDYVIPDDMRTDAESVLAHRLVLSSDAEFDRISPRQVVRNVLETTPAPGTADFADDSRLSETGD